MSALFRVQFGVVQRSRGDNALMRLAYQSCARVKHPSGTFDFRRKRHEHAGTVLVLPEGAPDWARDGAEIWRRAESIETRKNAQVARTGEITIPRQVPPHLHADFVRAACAPLVSAGMAVQADLHRPAALDGQEQPHAHIMATMRRFDATSPTGFEAKKALDWNGLFAEFSGGQVKGDKKAVKDMRQAMADAMNLFCAEHGIDYQADPRRLADRGETEPAVAAWKFEAHRAGRPQAEVADLAAYRQARAEAQAARAEADRLTAELAATPTHQKEPTHEPTPAPSDDRFRDPLDGPGRQGRHREDSRPPRPAGQRPARPHRQNLGGPGVAGGPRTAAGAGARRDPRRARELAVLNGGPRRPAEDRLADAVRAAKVPQRPPPGVRRRELAELGAPRPRPGDARLAAAVPAPRRRVELATADTEQARRQQAAFRKRMDAADKSTPDGRAAALREAYGLEGWMPKEMIANIRRIEYDAASGRVGLLLSDGTRIVDDGSRISLTNGRLTTTAADEMLAAVQRRGWTAVTLTGDDQFKNAMALRLALAEPPVAVAGHTLPPELQKQLEAELASRHQAADRRQQPAPETPPAPPPPRPEAAAAAWLHGRATERHRAAAELKQAREDVLDHGARHDRATDNALFALSGAERALAAHRAAGQPAGLVAKLSGRAAAWQEEEQRLDAARAAAEAELARLRDEKRLAHDLAAQEAAPLQRQAQEQHRQAEALERVAVAARRGDPRACAVAARHDDEAALRLAEQLRREHEQEERRRREAELARRAAADRQQQQGPTPGPAPGPRRR